MITLHFLLDNRSTKYELFDIYFTYVYIVSRVGNFV